MRNFLLISACVLSLLSLIIAIKLYTTPQPKYAYVNTQRLFDGFNAKKQYEKELITLKEYHRKVIDSILLVTKANLVKSVEQRTIVQDLQQKFLQEEEDKAATYTEEVLSQINQYVKDYGDKNEYDFIFGADGKGGLMYANEAKSDITSSVLEYINKRYEGASK